MHGIPIVTGGSRLDVQPFVPAALAATGVGTWDYDVRSGICCCDAVMSVIYGLTPEDGERGVSVAELDDLIHPDDRAGYLENRPIKMKRGGVFVDEFRITPKPGLVRWVLSRGRYEPDQDGKVVRARGIVIDVTESKQDGYAEGRAFFAGGAVSDAQAPVLRAVDHVLAARRAIEEMAAVDQSILLPAADLLLVTLARRMTADKPGEPN